MPYLIGIALALGVSLFAHRTQFDRDRVFYPTVMIIIASYYVLFAAMGGADQAVLSEAIVMAAFGAASVMGFRRSQWIVVIALACHGVFDALHHNVIHNPAVPTWWPAFCLAYDLVAAACLATIIIRRPTDGLASATGARP